MSTVDDLKSQADKFKYNPAGIQRTVLQLLKDVTNGEVNLVDATNPFIFCLETSSVLAAAAMSEASALTHKQYPVSSLNMDNLYNHMSDRDFVGRFATPSTTKFGILISKTELEKKVVPVPELGIKKLVIPRNTVFTIAEVNFSLQYPIEIRQMAHGGFQVVYDGDVVSPLQTLSTNHIEISELKNQDGEFLYFEVDVQQFDIISRTSGTSASVAFTTDITINDQFYFCRVYHENADGTWAEIATTYTTDIYDIKTPTAVVKVNDKIVTVEIPQIYTISNVLKRNIRIDIYQTKGPLNMVLANYSLDNFTAKWLAIDVNDQTDYVSPLNTFQTLMAFSKYNVSGGSNGIDFDTLRKRVITNSVGVNHIPITPDQLNTLFEQNGYDIVKNIDSLTNRIFLATRNLATPTNKITRTPANAMVATIQMSMEDIANLSGVIDNGSRLTITSDAVYRMINGITRHVTQEEVDSIKAQSADTQATLITGNNYFYSPFHYILDATQSEFAMRPYYMDKPEFLAKIFVAENDTTLLKVSVQSYVIEKTATGYRISIKTESGDSYRELDNDSVAVQLAYFPPGEKDRAYINGTLLTQLDDKERVFQFNINTKYDIDENDYLYLNNFLMYTQDQKSLPAPLVTEFDVIFTTNVNVGSQYSRSSIEDAMGEFLLPADSKAINHEKLRLKFGDSLTTLWSRNRTVVSSQMYRRYDADVPAIYENDIYEIDPTTGTTFKIENGQVVYTLLHKKGDPVLNDNGDQIYAYRAGDLMLDDQNKPIVISPRKITRLCDIFLIDGVYWFATAQAVVDYRVEMTNTLVYWLVNDLTSIESMLLEKTNIYFYPKTTIGMIDVLINEGTKMQIPAQQSFVVTLYVPDRVYSNEKLRETISNNTIDVLLTALQGTQLSVSGMEESLRQAYKDDVIEVCVAGFGGDDNIRVATLIDQTTRCSIKKKLVSLADNTLTLTDDIVISFVRHRLQ